MAVDQRLDLPNNVLVLLTEEDESGARNVALCVEFIDSIIEHDGLLPTLQTGGDNVASRRTVSVPNRTPRSEGGLPLSIRRSRRMFDLDFSGAA
jgi:hypothetical protein